MSVGTNVPQSTDEVKHENGDNLPCPVDEALSDSNETIQTIISRRGDDEIPASPGKMKNPPDATSRYVPSVLNVDPKNFDEVRKSLEQIVVQKIAETANDNRFASKSDLLKPLDAINNAIMSSHALAAYASTLDIATLKRLTAHIVADTGFWMARTFRFPDGCIFCHDDAREGLVRVTRMLLHHKYEKYDVDAYQTLLDKPPCIYVLSLSKDKNRSERQSTAEAVCSSLGLPRGCLRNIPSGASMTSRLTEQMQEDEAKNRTPLLVILSLGSYNGGSLEDLRSLRKLCQERKLWLHVDGFSLFSLVIGSGLVEAQFADSMSLAFGSCLGVPSLPYVTLYRPLNPTLAFAAGLTLFNIHSKLHCLPLWTTLQCLGERGVSERVSHCFDLNSKLLGVLQSHGDCIEVLGVKKRVAITDVRHETSRMTDVFELLESVSPMVIFRFCPPQNENGLDATQTGVSEVYTNNLNLWLIQMVHRESPSIPLELIEIENHGVFIKFSPFDSMHVSEIFDAQMDSFCEELVNHILILHATVNQKLKFHSIMTTDNGEQNRGNLRLVEIQGWAGLGGLRFIPTELADKGPPFSEAESLRINEVNASIVARLRESDSAFSLGIGTDGMNCVGFGMVTDDLNVEELISMVDKFGSELEENSKQLEEMSILVRQAVEQANAALEKETEERIFQEGILKHVPIVGSIFQWLAPSAEDESGIKGRTFNISSGMVETTENIYKYHMQLKTERPGTVAQTSTSDQQQIGNPL